MIYTPEEAAKIKQVLGVFQTFIEQSAEFDIVYSRKAGYLLLEGGAYLNASVPEPIPSAAYLCLRMFDKVADACQNQYGYLRNRRNISAAEKAAVLCQIRKYSVQLPEYRDLEELVFRQNVIDSNGQTLRCE